MFSYDHVVKLHETDAAGLLFFSRQFEIIHDAYESLLEKWGFGFSALIRDLPYFLPIVHASSNYKKPLFVGDRIRIEVTLGKIGDSSFSFLYKILLSDGVLVGDAETVHVTMNKTSQSKISLPPDMRQVLEKFQNS